MAGAELLPLQAALGSVAGSAKQLHVFLPLTSPTIDLRELGPPLCDSQSTCLPSDALLVSRAQHEMFDNSSPLPSPVCRRSRRESLSSGSPSLVATSYVSLSASESIAVSPRCAGSGLRSSRC